MSQHILYTTLKGHKCEIQMGWDTPLNWYYLLISPVLKGGEIGDPIYSNLDEPNAASIDLAYYIDICNKMGIVIPTEMITAIEDDRKNRRMNHRVVYTSQ